MRLRRNPSFRLPGWLGRLFRPSYPTLAVEIRPGGAAAVLVEKTRRGKRLVGHATCELPAGLVEPGMVNSNILDPRALSTQLSELVRSLGEIPRVLSLVLPDRVAKVSLVSLDNVPRSAEETRDLLIWKLKKATPFRVEEGRLAFQPFPVNGGGSRYLVAFVQSSVVTEYEQAALAAGLEPSIVDLSSFNLFNLFHDLLEEAAGQGDVLVINLAEDYFAALIARQVLPIFYRCKGIPPSGEGIAAVCDEIHPTLLYYQDKLDGTRLDRVFVRGQPEAAEALTNAIRERYELEVSILDAGRVLDLDGLDPASRDALTPALGAVVGR